MYNFLLLYFRINVEINMFLYVKSCEGQEIFHKKTLLKKKKIHRVITTTNIFKLFNHST